MRPAESYVGLAERHCDDDNLDGGRQHENLPDLHDLQLSGLHNFAFSQFWRG